MFFHEYMTCYTRLGGSKLRRTPTEFYQDVIEEAKKLGQEKEVSAQVGNEAAWIADGKPYYRVYPEWVAMLMNSKMDIPSEVFKMPHRAFAVYLPKMEMLKFQFRDRTLELRSLLCAVHLTADRGLNLCMAIVIDDSERDRSVVIFDAKHGKTMRELHDEVPCDNSTSRDLCRCAVKLATSVAMLATSAHRSIECEVLAALRERYRESTDQVERDRIVEKSKRRGVYGWSVGRDLKLFTVSPRGQSDESGNELSYQHIRGGHWHTVRYGVGRNRTRVQFFEPTIVRPDLPPKPVVV